MELPRDGHRDGHGQAGEGEEKGGRFNWGRGSGEVLGRILRRKG
jgi:hypothetical protein